MLNWGLEWQSLDSYFQFQEIVAPTTPESNHIRLYAKDNGSGVSTLCYKNDAGTEICFPASGAIGTITGTGVANRLAIWTGASTLSSDADLTFVTDTLTATRLVVPTSATFSFLTSGRIPFASTGGLLADAAGLQWDGTALLLGLGVLHGGSASNLSIDTNIAGGAILEINNHDASPNPLLFFHSSRGTHASPTVVASGDNAGFILGNAYGGTSYHTLAQIGFQVDGTPGNNDMPGRIVFSTTADGAASVTERFRIGSAGQWGIGGATYGTSGQVFTSGGASAAPTWSDAGVPGGSDTHIQFNDSGAFGGSANLTWDGSDLGFGSGIRARMLSQNRFRHLNSLASATNSGNQETTSGSTFTLSWDTNDIATDGIHSTSVTPTRWIAPIAGKYLIGGVISFASNATGGRYFGYQLNGAGANFFIIGVPAQSTSTTLCGNSALVSLAAGGYIEFKAFQDSGGALDVTTTDSKVFMYYVGE